MVNKSRQSPRFESERMIDNYTRKSKDPNIQNSIFEEIATKKKEDKAKKIE